MNITEKELSDNIENLGSSLANFSLIAMASQTVWPVPGFVMPHWVTNVAFGCAIAGFGIRTMSKSVAGIVAMFLNTPPTPSPKV